MDDTTAILSDPKRRVGARVHARAHFKMSLADAKRKFGSYWNRQLVSGTVISVDKDTSGKRSSFFLNVKWELPGEERMKRVNVRSVLSGEAPFAAEGISSAPNGSQPSDYVARVEGEEGCQHVDNVLHSCEDASPCRFGLGVGTVPVAGAVQVVARTIQNERNLQDETYFNAHGITWHQIEVIEPVGGAVPYRPWNMATAAGETIIEGGGSGPATPPRRPFDYFWLLSRILSLSGWFV
jgi:hypothetical protein